jgi:hypothetical protein
MRLDGDAILPRLSPDSLWMDAHPLGYGGEVEAISRHLAE